MELEARVRAHLRRETRHNFEAQVRFSGDLTIDYAERCLFLAGKRVGLAKKEFEIVEHAPLRRCFPLCCRNPKFAHKSVPCQKPVRDFETAVPQFRTLILLDLVLSGATISLCEYTAEQIQAAYPSSGEKYYLTNEPWICSAVYSQREIVAPERTKSSRIKISTCQQ